MHGKLFLRCVLFCLAAALNTSCCPYKIPTDYFKQFPPRNDRGCSEEAIENKRIALDHPIYSIVPRHRCQIRWYDLGHWCAWILLGNEEDGVFGEEVGYQLGRPVSMGKYCSFGCRNPLHNFTSYVIGSKDRAHSAFIILQLAHGKVKFLCYEPIAKTVFPCHSTCFYVALHGWKPFVSFRCQYSRSYRSDFYAGWRCNGGFGLKVRPISKMKRVDRYL